MSLDDLLVELARRNVKMWAEDDQLRLRAPKGVLTPELQSKLSDRKPEILTLLRQQAAAAQGAAIPLEAVPRDSGSELSSMQERLWFLAQMYPRSAVYNLPNARRMRGPLDVEALRTALETIVERHEILRTTFQERGGQPFQVVNDANLDFKFVDLGTREDPATEASRLAVEETARPFDLGTGPLLRVSLDGLGPDDHLFFWSLHHIVFDGWSSMVFLRELQALYEDGSSARLPELPVQFGDFAVWERKWLQSGILESQLSYWRSKLGGNLPVLELPADHPRPANLTYEGSCLPLALPADVLDSLKQLAKRSDTTLFMVLTTALKVLLYRYTTITDICVGTPVARRNRPEIENAIGCFINTLPLRTDLSEDPSLLDLLARVKQTCIEAFARQDVPFQRLVEELSPVRDLSHTPIFQIMFILHVQDTRKISRLGDVEIAALEYHAPTSKVDLTLELKETDDGLEGWFEYSTDLFDESTVGRMAAQFERLLESIVSDPARRISELDILPSDERRRLLVEWNATESDHPRESTVQELFAAQSARTPKSTAVVCRGESLSYAELDARSNQLARHLDSLGVGVETPVGLYLEGR